MIKIQKSEEIASSIGTIIEVHGSIYKIRKMSGFSFLLLRMQKEVVQCILTDAFQGNSSELVEESCVCITASVEKEERAKLGYELNVLKIEYLSKPYAPLPLVINQKEVKTSMEQLLHARAITLRNEKQRAIFYLQEGITNACRTFLQGEGFVEIHSPKIVGLGAEGGANIFSLEYFGQEAYLAQSPQIYKQMMVGVMERVFEIAPVFRAEKHDTKRHLNEYIGIDFEMGYITDFFEIMKMEEKMIQFVLLHLKEKYANELDLWGISLEIPNEIPKIKFAQAKHILENEFHMKQTDTKDLSPAEEKILCQWSKNVYQSEFLFVTHYPDEKRPFYVKNSPENPSETNSFDLLYGGIEITTGGQRIHDYKEQLEKMQRRKMTVDHFEEYLMLHKYGVPPHGGLGMGLERFLASILCIDDVRYTSLFPRDTKRLIP